MTFDQDRSHFTMWCMLAAPLLAGNDLTSMSNETLAILTAPELIAVNQDPLVIQAVVAAESNAPNSSALESSFMASDGVNQGNGTFDGPFVGVPEDDGNRRCGSCCTGTWPHDMGSNASAMCKGADADGQLEISYEEVSQRCAADSRCAGFANLTFGGEHFLHLSSNSPLFFLGF